MRKFIRILMFVVLGSAIVGTLVFLWNKSKPKEVKYEIITPQKRDISKKIIVNGTIRPRNEILIKPQISGIITDIYKEPGKLINVGEAIAKVKVVPDISSLSSAESRLKIANISFEKIKKEFDRNQQLFDNGVLSKELYDNSFATYLQATEEVTSAEESLEIIKQGMSKNTQEYSNTVIKSTIRGMILDIPVKVGNSVIQTNNFNDGTTIASIADMNDLIFVGQIDETDVGKVYEGCLINLIIGAMTDEECPAILEFISPQGVIQNGATTFEIKAAIKNVTNFFIRSGYSANGEIIVDKKENILTVPESTLEFSGDSIFVYVTDVAAGKDKNFVKTPVRVGISDGVYIEILSGIDSTKLIRGSKITSK